MDYYEEMAKFLKPLLGSGEAYDKAMDLFLNYASQRFSAGFDKGKQYAVSRIRTVVEREM